MLDHHARQAAQHHFDATLEVHPTARAVDIAHADGDAFDGARVPPELFAESSPDVRAVIGVERDPVDANTGGCQRCGCSTGRPLHRPGHVIRERFSLVGVSSAYAVA